MNNILKTITHVLFDLDGTLFDTAPDMANAINLLLKKYNKPAVDYDQFRWQVYGESKKMVCVGFDIDPQHPDFSKLQQEFLEIYQNNLIQQTRLFTDMDKVLNYLDKHSIPWGIVTNKPTKRVIPLLKHFDLYTRSKSIVCGDTLNYRKPDPAPLLHACALAKQNPATTLYIGDSETDIIAAKAARMYSIAACYGYHSKSNPPDSWNADLIIRQPREIIDLMATDAGKCMEGLKSKAR